MADNQTTVALNIGSQRIGMAVFEVSKSGSLVLTAYDSESIVADPALDACDGKTPMMLPSFARPVAASSDVRLVVSPRSIMVRVNAATSARFTHS